MTRKTKAIGLAILAVLAANALLTATARAAPEFQTTKVVETEGAEEEVPVHAPLDATQVGSEPVKLSLGSLSVTCTSVTATATLEKPSPTVAFSPSFGGCKVVVLGITFPTEINTGSCSYVVHATEESEAGLYKAAADISCPAGKEMLVTVKNPSNTKTQCLIHIPPQSGLQTVKLKNATEASPDHITLTNEVGTMHAVVTKGEESCPFPNGTYSTGKLTGSTTVTATGVGEAPVPPLNLVARNFHFEFEEKDIYFVWTQDSMQKFGFDLGTIECPELRLQEGGDFSGLYFATSMTSAGTSEGFENCKFGMQPAEIALNACFYKLAAHGIEFGEFVGRTFIECLALQEIEVKVPECTIFIPEQLGTGGAGMRRVVFKDVGAGSDREITASIMLKAIRYEEVGEGCKSGGPKINGTFTGSWNLKTIIAKGNQHGLSLAKTP